MVTRHYALRYKSECLKLTYNDKTKYFTCSNTEVTIHTRRKNSGRLVVPIYRSCICKKQATELCGACCLRKKRKRNNKSGNVFGVSYRSALFWLKEAAAALKWDDPDSWASHCFRRGWGQESYQHGGLGALFFSGGWKGLAAFGYLSAKQRSSMEAAEFAINWSDEDGDSDAESDCDSD